MFYRPPVIVLSTASVIILMAGLLATAAGPLKDVPEWLIAVFGLGVFCAAYVAGVVAFYLSGSSRGMANFALVLASLFCLLSVGIGVLRMEGLVGLPSFSEILAKVTGNPERVDETRILSELKGKQEDFEERRRLERALIRLDQQRVQRLVSEADEDEARLWKACVPVLQSIWGRHEAWHETSYHWDSHVFPDPNSTTQSFTLQRDFDLLQRYHQATVALLELSREQDQLIREAVRGVKGVSRSAKETFIYTFPESALGSDANKVKHLELHVKYTTAFGRYLRFLMDTSGRWTFDLHRDTFLFERDDDLENFREYARQVEAARARVNRSFDGMNLSL